MHVDIRRGLAFFDRSDRVLGRPGSIEGTILRHRAPPARLMADWFGDHVLTYAGEIVGFFTGRVVGRLPVQGR